METNSASISIEVIGGTDDGRIYEFNKCPVTLGRHHEDDLYLPYDTRVSRHHARILRDGKTYFLEDVGKEGKGSTNGTYLNNTRIAVRTLLSSGDIFLVGNVWLRFRVLL